MKPFQDKLNRRDFFRTVGRNTILGISVIGGGKLIFKKPDNPSSIHICINKGICRNCGIFSSCVLPQALSAKQYEEKQSNQRRQNVRRKR